MCGLIFEPLSILSIGFFDDKKLFDVRLKKQSFSIFSMDLYYPNSSELSANDYYFYLV